MLSREGCTQHLEPKDTSGPCNPITTCSNSEMLSLARFLFRGILAGAIILALFPENPKAQTQPHPPIAVRFHLDQSAFVTLVIEDEHGMRVRNLVSETRFPAGDNVAWWDGLDDLGRDPDSAAHGVYRIPGKVVAPGTYTVRGLYRQAIDLKYEFAVYNPGQPPWATTDTSSEWLTNHTPPSSVCFIPPGQVPVHGKRDAGSTAQVLIESYVAEGGSVLAWVDLDGHNLHGQTWVGGDWTGAQQIARDSGPRAQSGIYAYVASSLKGELRLHELVNDSRRKTNAPRNPRLGNGEDPSVLNPSWKFPSANMDGVGGLAAHNGLVVVSLTKLNQLLLVDAAQSRAIGTLPVPDPHGLFADGSGNLFVISQKNVLKITLPDSVSAAADLGKPQTVIGTGLEDPQGITMDSRKNLYVSDWGASNQVKVFSPEGKFLSAIGMAGVPVSGPYDAKLMHHPKGIAIDSRNQLWVAEEDFQPKRVSVWSLNGQLLRAFYGPVTYGGGGNLDPRDKTSFYLDGMTFRLDWTTGESRLTAIHYRPKDGEPQLVPEFHNPDPEKASFQEKGGRYKGAGASESPDLPIYVGGNKYFTNAYNSNPYTGSPVVGVWIDKAGVAVPVAAFGAADAWPLLQDPAFRSRIPASATGAATGKPGLSAYTFVWSDLNGNGIAEPNEVAMAPGTVRSATVAANLELVTDTATSYKPVGFNKNGAPLYDLSKSTILCPQTQKPTSTGGQQVLPTASGWTVLTTGPKPFASQSVAGAERGVAKWSYPSLWPGLHASHNSPVPAFPGELIGTTRLLGPSFQLRNPAGVELWAINGNKGVIYLFTTDGLFVATLFRDSRAPSSSWTQRSKAIRGMSVSDLTTGEENFWPSITQTEQGEVYVVTNFPAIVRVDGLDTIRRIVPSTVRVSPEMLAKAQTAFGSAQVSRQNTSQAPAALLVPVSTKPLTLDGDLSKWDPKQFVTIDEPSNQAVNSEHPAPPATAALRIARDSLYAAFRTGDAHALDNSGSSMQNLFKTGGALDLMLATNPNSDPRRKSAAAGDIRLLVALVKGQPKAMLYRPVASTGAKNTTLFESPLRTIKFDDVEDVSQYVRLAKGMAASAGDFEFSIPLAVLGLNAVPGTTLRGDLGLLRGDGLQTTQRVYWSNKASGLVSDIPSEAELTPQLWGTLKLVADNKDQSH